MKKRILALLFATVFLFSGCGSTTVESNENENISENTNEDTSDDTSEDSAIEVEEELFDVTITLSADLVGEDVTQESLEEELGDGVHSVTLNEDGSVTYVMSKKQHKAMLEEIAETIDESMEEMAQSEDYPNITKVESNDDYTSFTVTMSSTEEGLGGVLAFYTLYAYGYMYASFEGEEVDNIHVDFVNVDSGEIINSYDSRDIDLDSDESLETEAAE